jgi:hypothetical protein
MSRFERNTVAAIPELGRVGLETPGRAVVLPEVGEAARLADSLAASLGMAERATTQIVAADEQERVALRGTAAKAAAGLLPQIRQEIDSGQHGDNAFLIESDDSAITSLAENIARSRSGVENPEYTQAFVDSLKPAVAEALFSKKRTASGENNAALAQTISDAAVVAKDEASLTAAYDAYMKIPGATPEMAAQGVGLAALNAAAITPGGEAQFEMVRKWLGPRYAAEQRKAAVAMSRTSSEAQSNAWDASQESIIAMVNAGQPAEAITASIDEMVKTGRLSQQRALTLRGAVGQREAQARAQAEKGVVDFVNQLALGRDFDVAIDHADTALRNGQIDGTTHASLVSNVQARRSSSLYDFYLGEIMQSGAPDERLRSTILRDAAGRPGEPRVLDPQQAASLLSTMDTVAARATRQQAEAQKGLIVQQQMDRAEEISRAGMDGGLALSIAIPKNQRFSLVDGSFFDLERDTIIDAKRQSAFEGFVRERLPQGVEPTGEMIQRATIEALPDMIQWTARHGVDVPEWPQTFKVGASMTAEELASPTGRGAAMRAMTLYRAMKATNRSVLAASMPAEAREFWSMVDARLGESRTIAGDQGAQDDVVNAMLRVRELMDNDNFDAIKGSAAGSIREKEVRQLITSSTIGTPSNLGQIIGTIQFTAATKAMFSGDPTAAIKSAIEDFKASHVEANGVMVPLGMRGIPQSVRTWMPTLSREIIEDYVRTKGAKQGYDVDDLTITASEATGFFYITEKATGAYARSTEPGDARAIQFSAQELDAKGRDLIKRGIMNAVGTRIRVPLNPTFTSPGAVMPR